MSGVVEKLIIDLPDADSARKFFGDFSASHAAEANKLLKKEGLLSDLLTLASYSPLLATTLLQNPGYTSWLNRRRADMGGRSKEELLESLARFALTNSQIETQMLLARFRRRELLRIFLRDIRRLATIAEITEEISNLADAILEHSLRAARQELENRFGLPLETDEKGRSRPAGFCIVSLGKLGSRELNYSSDIDLLFLYSDDGTTSGTGARGSISNREFSIKLAERVTKLVGEQTGEGAAYRVDLRLRPHGTIGPLAMSVKDTVRYYLTEARSWELQVMIRSRASAGDPEIFKDFFAAIEDHVFSADESIEDALANVRRSKERINEELKSSRGYNVKLGRGGIREIEFIAQALQLAFGGNDRWLRSPHTLISLARLADRGLLTSAELTELFDAYDFLRRLEHILQMEHGVQTHTLPDEPERRSLIAAKMNPAEPQKFEKILKRTTRSVSRVFSQIFDTSSEISAIPKTRTESKHGQERQEIGTRLAGISPDKEKIVRALSETSPRFAGLLFSDPELIDTLPDISRDFEAADHRGELLSAVQKAGDFRGKLAALRKAWHRSILRLAAFDVLGKLSLTEAKAEQTALAEASIDAAFAIASDELAGRLSIRASPLRMAALGLGKLGGGGVDYDSDLDLILVYDDREPPPAGALTHAEFFARAAELFVTTLSSMTRHGSLYRVDLRLRPHGKNGPSAVSLSALADYTKDEAAVWELLAYIKLRWAGGDGALAKEAESTVREIIHTRAASIETGELRDEVLRVRQRLEAERAGRLKANEVDIKYGAGGLLDIYFAARFLQLRDNVPDDDDNRSTASVLQRLCERGSLGREDFKAFSEGYVFLSALDHGIRLAVGRTTRLPIANRQAMDRITTRMNIDSAETLAERLALHRLNIRAAFENVLAA